MKKSDIEKIMFDRCIPLFGKVFLKDNMPLEEVQDERIIIIVNNTSSSSKFWFDTQVKVNWCVPDVKGEPATPRVEYAESALQSLYYGIGDFNGIAFRYKKKTTDTFADSEMRCHIVNVTLNFQHQKLMNYEQTD